MRANDGLKYTKSCLPSIEGMLNNGEAVVHNAFMAKTKAEYNAYMRQYMKKRYDQRFGEAKKLRGGKCKLCGGIENLEFHHRDPKSKKFDVSKIWNKPGGIFEQELEKCDLLCEECHKKQHSAREKHGTLGCYRYCRCDACRQAHNEYGRRWKQKQKTHGHLAQLARVADP